MSTPDRLDENMLNTLRRIKNALQPEELPEAAKVERGLDRSFQTRESISSQLAVDTLIDWLCEAQDQSRSKDGGVAREYSLIKGWSTSYPETTGYIIPTIIAVAQRRGSAELHARARRMLDWCVGIQYPEGGFQGGRVDATPKVPVTFNTGQILIGLSAGTQAYGDAAYRQAMNKAAAWLRDTLDEDGCWRRYPTPFAKPGEKAYETHVSWGLFEAERLAPGQGFGDAGLRQVQWALTKQHANGWFASNCLEDPSAPLTHTIGYVLRGVLEAHRLTGDPALLEAAKTTGDSICRTVDGQGRLAGRIKADWSPAVDWVCLTGSAQIAHCLMMLHQHLGGSEYLGTAKRLNQFVRNTIRPAAPVAQRGVKGSFPVDGDYGRFEYLNWAAKFCIDSLLLEGDITGEPLA